jgi:peptidoglycan/LPS O-acetylase OafA/YrhL
MKNGPALKSATKRLDSLTSLRFLGAVFVVLFHWLLGVRVISNGGVLWRFVAFAQCSVNGFFLLSGFILAWVYLRDGKRLNKRKFYVARFARIYPLFLLTVLVDCPWYFLSHIANYGLRGALIKTGISFASCLFMLQAWGRRFWGLNIPSWSLSVETLFYAIFPFIAVLLWRIRKGWIWPAMLLVYVSGQILVLSAVKMTGYYPIDPEFVLYLPPLHVSTFLLGVLLAKLRVNADEKQQESGKRAWTPYMLLMVVGTTCVALALIVPNSMINSRIGEALILDGAFAPLLCGLIWALSDSTTLVFRLLTAKWAILLGEASFGLYLIHYPVLHLLLPMVVHALRELGWREFRVLYLLSFFAYLALCIALSIAGYRWFEGPARKSIRTRLGSRPRAGTGVITDGPALGNSDLRPSPSVSS